jgi:transposase
MAADWGGGEGSDGAQPRDVRVKHHHQHGADGPVPPSAIGRRVEVITSQRRRSWGVEEKAAITAESFAPGANVAEVARRHGVSVGLLHYWRRKARRPVAAEAMRFMPVVPEEEPRRRASGDTGSIQIDYGGARIRVDGAVDPGVLAAILSALQNQT